MRYNMLDKIKFSTSYDCNGQSYTTTNTNTEHFDLNIESSADTLKVKLFPKQKISNLKINVNMTYNFSSTSRVYCNGYESWTDSKEFFIDEKIDRIKGIPKLLNSFHYSGDEYFIKYKKSKGCFHSFSYTYIRENNNFILLGSMSERNGYTVFYYDCLNNSMRISKDLDKVTFESEYLLFDIKCYNGEYNNVFDKYFADMNIPKPRETHACGYTSWYNYFTNITQDVINNDLDSFKKKGRKIDVFQIDDGYQTKVGDWLSLKPCFPDGMRAISDSIHNFGAKAGLWLAPFNCVYGSETFKNHQDWLVKGDNGKPLIAGKNWSLKGFFTLDIYNPQAKAYIQNVFSTVLNDWNFDLVKLDFLYSECMQPRNNKSRGQIMCEAMDFLRECVGDKLILGCGVPLAPSFGLVDFCRTGPDVSLTWGENYITSCTHRERVSTKTSINNTLFRRHLDGRAFVNDPDVFFLRDYNIKHSQNQKRLLANINKLFGNLLFVSDDIMRYTPENTDLLNIIFDDSRIVPLDAKYLDKNTIQCDYTINGECRTLIFNLNNGEVKQGNLL